MISIVDRCLRQPLVPLALLVAFAFPSCTNAPPPHLAPVAAVTEGSALPVESPEEEPSLGLHDERPVRVDNGSAWLQLTSGEWLTGSLVRIQLDKVTFQSSGIGEQDFDISKVKELIGVKMCVILADDDCSRIGIVSIEGDVMTVRGAATEKLKVDRVISVLATDGEHLSIWKSHATLGTTFRSGNTDQTDYTLLIRSLRETAGSRWESRYVGALTSVNGSETANNHRVTSKFDLSVSRRLFLTIPGGELFRDRFQNIDLRATPRIALGYTVFDRKDKRWSVSAGPAYRYQRLTAGIAGQDQEESTAAGFFSTHFYKKVNAHVNLHLDYDLTVPVPATEEYNHSLLLSLGIDLPGNLDLDIAFIWDRVNRPSASSDGTFPEPDDFRTTIGLGWSF